MHGLEGSKEVLSQLGLSEYEARVYYSLIMEGVSGARKLSLNCGVPRTKIYHTIQKLEERGLVYELPESPSIYSPNSPAVAFQKYISHFKRETSQKVISLMECKETVLQLEEVYDRSDSHINPQREEAWVYTNWNKIVKKINEVLLQARNSIEIIIPREGLAFLYKIAGHLFDELVEKGISIKVFTNIGERNGFPASELKYVCSIEHVEIDFPILYLCADGELSLLIRLTFDDKNSKKDEAIGVLYNNSKLCKMFFQLFIHSKRQLAHEREQKNGGIGVKPLPAKRLLRP